MSAKLQLPDGQGLGGTGSHWKDPWLPNTCMEPRALPALGCNFHMMCSDNQHHWQVQPPCSSCDPGTRDTDRLIIHHNIQTAQRIARSFFGFSFWAFFSTSPPPFPPLPPLLLVLHVSAVCLKNKKATDSSWAQRQRRPVASLLTLVRNDVWIH